MSPSITGNYTEPQPTVDTNYAAAAASPTPEQALSKVAAPVAAGASAEAGGGVDPDTGLPIGWIWQMDPNTQRPYYVNTMTGQTQWEAPQPTAPTATPVAPTPAPVMAPNPMAQTQPSVMTVPAQAAPSTLPGLPKTDGFKSGPGPRSEAYVPTGSNEDQSMTSASPAPAVVAPAVIPTEYAAIEPAIQDLTTRLTHACTTPPEKKQLAEAIKASHILLNKLKSQYNGVAMTPEIANKAVQMIVSVQYGDFVTATGIHKDLSVSAWDTHKDWIKGVKGFIVLGQKKFR